MCRTDLTPHHKRTRMDLAHSRSLICPICGTQRKTTRYGLNVSTDTIGGIDLPNWEGHEPCLREAEIRDAKAREKDFRHQKRVTGARLFQDAFTRPEDVPQGQTLEKFIPCLKTKSAWERVKNFSERNLRGAILAGPPGSGKTHLVKALVYRATFDLSMSAQFVVTKPWLDFILRAPWEESEYAVKQVAMKRLLVIDDLAAGGMTEAADERLKTILEARDKPGYSTWFTTNLSEKSLLEAPALSARLKSRILALADVINVVTPDHRLLRRGR